MFYVYQLFNLEFVRSIPIHYHPCFTQKFIYAFMNVSLYEDVSADSI